MSSQIQIEQSHTTSARQLLGSLKDPAYRTEFVGERVRSSIALQVRALREQRQMTQRALGDILGMAQTWVSKLENPDYGKMTVATLLRLAEAFHTDLEIKFRSFSTTLGSLPKQGPDYFHVLSFDDELPLLEQSFGQPALGRMPESLAMGMANTLDANIFNPRPSHRECGKPFRKPPEYRRRSMSDLLSGQAQEA